MAAPSNKLIIPNSVKRLGKLFEDAGYQIRLVGGWVRDSLQDRDPKDLDLATTATPQQMVSLFEQHNLRYWETGIAHGTITVLPTVKIRNSPTAITKDYKRSIAHPETVPAYEITTLRIDTETDGRHAEVEFTTDWRSDAARRDFTINAMSMNLEGEVFDYFGGIQHLCDKRVVFVGDPEDRIKEDFLRILRYFRFRDRLGDRSYDRDLKAVIRRLAVGLLQISSERVWMEMQKIFSGDSAMLCLLLIDMLESDVLGYIGLPDVERYDIVHATIVREQTANPLTVLAALTPDDVGASWKMSGYEMGLLRLLQKHRRIPRPDLAYFKELAFDYCVFYAVECASLFGPSDVLDQIREWDPPVFPIRGADLVDKGMEEGPAVGAKLRELVQVWKASDYRLDRVALLACV